MLKTDRIGILCKPRRNEPYEILKALVPDLAARGAKVFIEDTIKEPPSGAQTCSYAEMPAMCDMIIVLGGDGTMLGAARLASGKRLPLLGVNLGGLGFITEVSRAELTTAIDDLFADRCTLERRMMLNVELIRDGGCIASHEALNDIVINKGILAKIVDLKATVNGLFLNIFKSDGIIVASPTGSTAYSMSADGPILYPTLNCMVINPICPHTLSNRPIVLTADSEIVIELVSQSEGVLLNYDGLMAENLKHGDRVRIRQSENYTTFVMPPGRDHFQVLRSKLGWGEQLSL